MFYFRADIFLPFLVCESIDVHMGVMNMHYFNGFFNAPYIDMNQFDSFSCCCFSTIPLDRQNTCSVITAVLEYWSVLAYYRSSESAYPVKQCLQKNKVEQVDRADAVMSEAADDSHDQISQ